MVVGAEQATSRIRLGTLVLNVPSWNPALVVREIATADVFTDGQLEVGLGSGHMKHHPDDRPMTLPLGTGRSDRPAIRDITGGPALLTHRPAPPTAPLWQPVKRPASARGPSPAPQRRRA
jgi:alkanesulfonate monooxygenase SsuD/methylene tetrahydromethanopterin reductase-like flavin-dependent oxidoreductase (luciferase family)